MNLLPKIHTYSVLVKHLTIYHWKTGFNNSQIYYSICYISRTYWAINVVCPKYPLTQPFLVLSYNYICIYITVFKYFDTISWAFVLSTGLWHASNYRKSAPGEKWCFILEPLGKCVREMPKPFGCSNMSSRSNEMS